MKNTCPHTHVDEKGLIVRCLHKCSMTFKNGWFWVALTCNYPIEHFIWEKLPPFCYVTNYFFHSTHTDENH